MQISQLNNTSIVTQKTVAGNAVSTSQATAALAGTAVPAELDSKEKLFLAIDAEWESRYKLDLALSLSIQNGPRCIVLNENIEKYLDYDVYQRVRQTCDKWEKDRGVKVLWFPFTDGADFVNYFLNLFGIEVQDVSLRMFASPKDLSIGFGFDNLKNLYESNSLNGIQQKRSVTARNLPLGRRRFSILDLKGLIPTGGLKDLAEAVGHTMTSKDDMDVYKSRMLDGLVEETEKFLDYALADAEDLHIIHDLYNEYVRTEICEKILGVEFPGGIPMTTGSIGAKAFQSWIHTLPENKTAFEFAIRKLGILNDSCKQARKNRILFNDTIDSVNSVVELKSEDLETLESVKFRTLGYSQAGVQELARLPHTGAFNSLVMGGRCVNEHPYSYTITCSGADIDMQGCYGSALAQFIYPIGLPSVKEFSENARRVSLKQWLAENEKDLYPGLWQVVVTGDLPFRQDLIYSKLVDLNQIKAAVHSGWVKDEMQAKSDEVRDQDLKHIPGIFALIRKQIQNGIITSDLLEIIRKVSTDNELKAWMGLEVVTAAWYKASDRVDTIDEWSAAVIADKGRYEAEDDTRSRKWVGIPIGNFIGPLVAKRKEIKQLAKSDQHLQSLNLMLKLFINILYGCLASIYFDIGNAVVANNITAKARLGAWMMSKALWTRQSITDGGIYSLMEVAFLDKSGSLPGFETLSDREKWLDRRRKNRKVGSLDHIDWNSRIFRGMTEDLKQLGEEVDALALQHINQFWGCYDLELPFNIEHKHENFFVRAAYWSKAHYALDLVKPAYNKYTKEVSDRHFIIRGAKFYSEEKGLKMSPMYDLLGNILDGSDEFPQELDYQHSYLLKIGKYSVIQSSKSYSDLKDYRPGDEVIENRIQRFNNSHFPCDTIDEFLSRYTRKTTRGTRRVEFFEKHRDKGIGSVLQAMISDRLR